MSELETLQINNIEYVRKDSVPEVATVEGTPIGQYCIVRCRDAGVWAGVVAQKEGREATITNARRLWSWTATKGHTLSAVSVHGISEGKVPSAVPIVYLTEACEFLPCTETAKASITKMAAHRE